jgi:hypothetical protein
LLKKWFILLIVLSFAFFAVSSGCSEKSKENITKNSDENTKQNITQDIAQNNNVNSSADNVLEGAQNLSNEGGAQNLSNEDGAQNLSNNSGGEMNANVELAGSSGEKTNISVESTGNLGVKNNESAESTGGSNNWCSVGSTWQTVNPLTNEEIIMKVTGIETVDGTSMCKSVSETGNNNDNSSRLEYLQSQDGRTQIWTSYDASGNKTSEVRVIDGKIEKVSDDGN